MDHNKFAAMLSSTPAFKGAYNKLANSIHALKYANAELAKEKNPQAGDEAVALVAAAIDDFGSSLKGLFSIDVPGYDQQLGKALLGFYGQHAANVVPAIESIIQYAGQGAEVLKQEVSDYLSTTGSRPANQAVLAYLKSPATLDALGTALCSIHDKSDADPANDHFGNMKQLDNDLSAIATAHNDSLSNRGVWNRAASEKVLLREKKVMKAHPEFIKGVLNAGSYFTFDKTPVVDPAVENPNQELTPTLNPHEVTGKDLLGLATYAAGLVDPRVAVGPGGRSGALLDAVLRAISEKDEGKYAGRLSSSTMDLVVAQTEKLLGKKSIGKPENQNKKYIALAEKGQKADPAGDSETAEIGVYEEPHIEEDSAIERPAPRTTDKQAAKKETPAKKVVSPEPTAPSLVDSLVGLGADMKGRSHVALQQAIKGVERKTPVGLRNKLSGASRCLDEVANQLEALGLMHLAAELDIVSNSLDVDTDNALPHQGIEEDGQKPNN